MAARTEEMLPGDQDERAGVNEQQMPEEQVQLDTGLFPLDRHDGAKAAERSATSEGGNFGSDRSVEPVQVQQAALNMDGNVPVLEPPTRGTETLGPSAEAARGGLISSFLAPFKSVFGIGKKKGSPESLAPAGGPPGGQNGGGRTKRAKGQKKQEKRVSIWRLFRYADGLDIALMVVGSIAAIASGVARPLMTLLLGRLINAFGANLSDPNYLYNQVVKIALDFLYLALGAGVAGYLGMALWTLAGERQATRIRKRYLKAILRQDIGFFDVETSTGEVVGRMTGDTLLIQDAMSEKVEAFIRLMAQAVAGFVIAFTRGWLLALVLMSCLPLLVLSGGLMMMRMAKLATEGQQAYAEAGSLVEQVVGAIRTVASFVGERKAVQQYDARIEQAYKTGVKSRASSGLGLGTMIGVLYATYSLALWYGSRLIASHGYNGGEVLNVLMAVLIGGMSLGQTSPSLAAFGAGQAAAWKMFSVIERRPSIDHEDETGMTLPAVKGDIRLADVHFTYPARPDVPIFQGFDLFIPSGRTVALVGESGSGKSTIISLVERFYDPQEGAVMLDGIDIRKFQVKWLRQQIGLVSQEPALFTASILENVSYGKESATKEEVVAACKAANAHKFITKLPEGYNTQVGERGISLSGGQKQRIAIARAILKNPRILLLDEATSALDTESERKVQAALDQVMVGRTTVVVAHRLSTVINADKIAVVQRGHIVEEGPHAQLMANENGAYAALVKLQAMAATRKPAKPPTLLRAASSGRGRDRALISRNSNGGSSHHDSHSFILRSLTVSLSGGSDLGMTSRRVGFADDIEETTSEPPERRKRGRGVWGFWRKRGRGDEEAGTRDEAPSIPLGRLARLARPEWLIALAGVIVTGCNGAIMPIFALLLSRIINVFYNPDLSAMKKKADFWAGMFLMLAILSFVLLNLQYALFGVMGERLIRRVRHLTFKAVLRQDVAWFDDEKNSTGAVGSRLENDASGVKGIVGDQLALLTQNGITLIIGFVIAFLANWKLTLVVLSVMPLLILSGYCQIYILKGSSQKAKVMYEGASQVANDATGNIRTVAAFGAEQHVMDLYDARTAGPQKEGVKRSQINGAALGFNQFVSYAVYSLAFWYGGTLVRDGSTTFQNVFQVFFAIALSAQGVAQGTAMAPDIGKAKAAVQSIFAVLDRKPAVDADDVSGKKVERLEGSIAFRDVDFAYPSRPHVQVFNKMTFDVSPGQTVALVGESGSGKSTVISLVERFYDPQGGTVMIDGLDVRKYQLKSLRQNMGLVSQEPNLFALSIRDNITYGKDRATDEEIEAAARAANAWGFISALPQGLDTQVGERGVQLSGGQKQRVAIARAMLKDPRILLLDEATSALDAESERLVQEALNRIMKGRTTIVIAHRLTTIRNAHKIMVVKGGRIVEQGTHAELEEKEGGAYRNLVLLSDASTS